MVDYEKNKIIECLFDPEVSEILAELESGPKKSSYLVNKLGISNERIRERLAYLLEHKFVKETAQNNDVIYAADGEKLAEVIENNNFDTAIDGLTKMDSYLN